MGTIASSLMIFYGLVVCIQAATWTDVRDLMKNTMSSESGRKRSISELTLREVIELDNQEDLIEVDESGTIDGTTVKRYQETYRGIPVYDAYVSMETDQTSGEYTGQSSGKVLNTIAASLPDVKPRLDETEALFIAMKSLNIENVDNLRKRSVELKIYANSTNVYLVYEVVLTVVNNRTMKRPDLFIDANTGTILSQSDRLESAYNMSAVGGNTKTGKYLYGQKLPPLKVKKKGNTCILRNSNVRILDLQSKDKASKNQQAFRFNCSKGFNDSVNGGYSPLADAFFYSDEVIRMFEEWSNVDVIKQKPLDIWVHYSKNQVAARFDGAELVFGDGDQVTWFPLVSLDIFAHEMAHVFTEDHSRLEYNGQSGGISESYSDVIGEAAEFFTFGRADFHAGDDAYVKNNFGARDLCVQSRDGKSITDANLFVRDMNVHYSSGVFNKAACLMFKSPKLGVKATFQLFTHANRFYWHETSDFSNGACGVMKAAYDLGYDTSSVQQSFAAVGINVCDVKTFVRSIWEETEIKNLSARIGTEIAFRLDLSQISQPYVRVKTSGGSGDVDIFLGASFPMNSAAIISRSGQAGNAERMRVKTKSCAEYTCFIYLLPKEDFFSDVTLKVLNPAGS